jgi:pilus assembly protein CpaF
MQEIFRLDRKGIDAEGNVIAEIQPTGIRPRFAEKLKVCGHTLAPELFERTNI